MKKILCIIILNLAVSHFVTAQNHVAGKIKFPQSSGMVLLKQIPGSGNNKIVPVFPLPEKTGNTMLQVNTMPIIHTNHVNKISISFITEFAAGDLLEYSINSLKANLVNAYDDHITELFKEAPSLIKMSCIIPF